MSQEIPVEPEDIPDPVPPLDELGAESPFPIVGIGASAGGLEAFTQFLAQLPAETGMAFVLVQHLDPRHESRLVELLARATPMPVVEGSQGLLVAPDHVYIIPPNTSMALAQGLLQITPRAAQMLITYLSDLQDWKTEAISLGLKEADADQFIDIEQVRQRWEDKRARQADPQ